MSEHLYRDEVGAAVERLAHLEEENARLRAELARLTAPKQRAATHARVTAVTIVLLAGVLSLAGIGFRSGCPQRAATAKRARLVASQPTEFRVIRDGDDCTTPYYYDHNGVKRYRASCRAFGDPGRRF